ncbi:hypothetical protein [Flavobacterium sp.]|jgi:hypothetical protein|uniref:hypothetical protein n=1 Tax=Flavobacterium sp. TaxID=239 RepID=UPI003F69E3B4
MNNSFLKNPLLIFVIASVLALIPFLFDNENVLVMLRLLSFGMYFYAVHLLLKKKK